MFRAIRHHVWIGGAALVVVAGAVETFPIIVEVAGLICRTSIKASLRCPKRTNPFIWLPVTERSEATIGWPGVEVWEAVAIPIAHQIAGSGAETTGIPCVIGHINNLDVFRGEQRELRGETKIRCDPKGF